MGPPLGFSALFLPAFPGPVLPDEQPERLHPHLDGGKAHIEPSLCTGCTLCSQVCPVGAIGRNQQ